MSEDTKSVLKEKSNKGYFSTKHDIRLSIGIGEVHLVWLQNHQYYKGLHKFSCHFK